ncbi:hypothetical protein GW17_00021610 [Ensete ventricosum]|nr:hypothetical protein GW17_00021610 [Ensete ventricosum]
MMEETAAEYHSKDFEWEELRDKVENDASLRYHLVPFVASSSSSPSSDPPPDDVDAWRSFHRRHSAGKFFKVLADTFDTALFSLHFCRCLVTLAPNFVLLIIASGHFINERRYLLKEFPELLSSGCSIQVLELGCGNGSTILPILR